jgi:class 3 adenylate cyclase
MDEHRRKLVAIVFTDIVGFTEITSSDEGEAIRLLQWQRNTFQPMVEEHGGEWLKELGDGLLLSFPSSQDAVRCAIRIQEATREKPDLQIRIGIHQGDIIQEGPDILGDGVNIASRIQQIAPRGGIALSDKVQQDISGYPEFEVISLGQHSLKGVARPMEIYCLSPFGLPEIPEYRLLRLTGQGAYGEVWLAQSLTGVYRAVKIVHRDQFEDAKPYEREFTGITKYEPVSRKHEGLIDLLHVGHSEDDSFFYYVMELADDQRAREEINPREYRPRTLQSELEARGKLSIGECLEVGSRLARGLAFLHDHNLLHRDVKPANIVYVDGHPKLADIGLVTTMDNASTLVGTMGYIPPEGPGKPSSDIYALGMVLYELSTGKDRADFPEIDVLDPALSGLNQACLKACSNDLSERFADANAFADELDRLAGEPVLEQSPSTAPTGPYKMGALAAALILILGLTFFQRDGGSDKSGGYGAQEPTPSAAKDKPISGPSSPPTAQAPVDLTKGLVAYYPFNGNAKDESGNDHNGTVSGATPATDRYGNSNSAYNFDGVDDFIEAPSTAGMNHSDVKTVALWYAPNNTGTGQGQWCVGKYRADAFEGGWGLIVGTDNRLEYNYKRSRIIGGLHTRSTNPMGLGVSEWVHLAATVNGNTVTLFKDGQVIKVNTIIADRNPRDNTRPLLIGAGLNPKARSSFVNGKLDDIRIYNRALPAAEVAELYKLEKPTRERERPTLRQYEVDRNTVLLEHFEGATTGKSNRPVSFDKGRIGQGLRLTPKTFLSWDKGPLVEGTYEFWFKLDEEKYLGTLASANFLGLPTAITILIKSGEKGNVYSELFTQGPDWSRPKHIENKIRVKQWNHVAISWGRKGINTYLNGVRIGFLEGTHLLNRSTGTWVMGAQIRTASRDGFSGVIDEVRISRIQREFKPEDFTP